MTKQEKTGSARRFSKPPIVLAAALALLLALGAGAYGAGRWSGFALTEGLREREIRRVLDELSSTAITVVEPDGTVHYLGNDGSDVLVLSAEEAARYDRERWEAKQRAVRESTDLVDVDSLGMTPAGITELAVSPDGGIPDFAFGNGQMAVFYPDGGRTWGLAEGETVTLTLTTSDDCWVLFYPLLDGAPVEEQEGGERAHVFTFTAPAAGSYGFAVLHVSAGPVNCTDCRLTFR